MGMSKINQLAVDDEHNQIRLDVFLTKIIKDIPSRTFIQRLIEEGKVEVNGKPILKPHFKVSTGDKIVATISQEDFPGNLEPEHIPLDIFYEDDDLVVINKPVGMTVHPAAGKYSGTLVNALLYHFHHQNLSDRNGPLRPGIVHRLDRETSGLIIVAKNNVAHARLARQFEKRTVQKRYVALVKGVVEFDQGKVDAPIGDHDHYHDQKKISYEEDSRPAVTLYEVLKRFENITFIALYPQTGRTHQLRLHMKHLGHPILGDEKYGQKNSFRRLALHAQAIGFIHPTTKHHMEFCTRMPVEFLEK